MFVSSDTATSSATCVTARSFRSVSSELTVACRKPPHTISGKSQFAVAIRCALFRLPTLHDDPIIRQNNEMDYSPDKLLVLMNIEYASGLPDRGFGAAILRQSNGFALWDAKIN